MMIIKKISEFIVLPVTISKAYILGLMIPLWKEFRLAGNQSFIVGQVSHNHHMVTDTDLVEHFKSVVDMVNRDELQFVIKDNSFKINKKSISSKLGFSIIFENDLDDSEVLLNSILLEAIHWDDDNRKALIRGIFDGRSSVDTTYGFLSLDVDRDYDKQDIIKDIINSFGISVNINRRHINHTKKDQIRISKKDKDKYINLIGFLSTVRLNNYKKVG